MKGGGRGGGIVIYPIIIIFSIINLHFSALYSEYNPIFNIFNVIGIGIYIVTLPLFFIGILRNYIKFTKNTFIVRLGACNLLILSYTYNLFWCPNMQVVSKWLRLFFAFFIYSYVYTPNPFDIFFTSFLLLEEDSLISSIFYSSIFLIILVVTSCFAEGMIFKNKF